MKLLALVLAAAALVGCTTAPTDVAQGRTVQTSIGAVTVPAEVGSVVVLEGRRDLDIVLALRLPLTGFPREGDVSGIDAPLAGALAEAVAAGAEELFLADEVDLEAVAAARPSLIVGRTDDVGPVLAELQAIAPVIPVGSHADGVSWQDDLRLVAAATGREARAEQVLAEYDRRRDEISTRWSAEIASTVVAPVGYHSEGTEVQATRLQSVVLAELGARPSATFAQALASEDAVEVSGENTYQAYADADAILVLVNSQAELDAAAADPLWQRLPAVAADRVVRTDKMTHEGGPTTALAVLDLLEQLYASA